MFCLEHQNNKLKVSDNGRLIEALSFLRFRIFMEKGKECRELIFREPNEAGVVEYDFDADLNFNNVITVATQGRNDSEITVNGKTLECLQSFEYEQANGCLPQIQITLNVRN